MVSVYWLLQHVADVRASADWLSVSERDALAKLWAPKRVRDWRLGRWTAKRALTAAQIAGVSQSNPAAWAVVSIRATEAGVPYALVGETEAPWVLSLSHSGEYGLCAIAARPAAIGCDVETIGRRGTEFVVDWFTQAERAIVESIADAEDRARMVTLVWSAKESALKTLGVGLRLDTREVDVEISQASDERGWQPLLVHTTNRDLHGWWTIDADRVITIVSDPAPDVPVRLEPSAC